MPLPELTEDGQNVPVGNKLDQAEREQILRALKEAHWVVGGPNGAAARLGLKRTTLAYKMQKLGISKFVP